MLLQVQIGGMQRFGRAVNPKSLTEVIQEMANSPVIEWFLSEGFEKNRIGARVPGLEV